MKSTKPRTFSTDKTSGEFLEINAAGIEHITKKDRSSTRTAGRSDYHIIYVEKGFCHILLDGEWNKLSAGHVVLFRPFEPQRYYYKKEEGSVSHYVHFAGTGCEAILKRLGLYGLRTFDMGRSPSYERLSGEMVREHIMRKPGYKDMTAALLYQMLTLVGREYALQKGENDTKSDNRINEAIIAIFDHLENPPSVEELSEKHYLSVSRFLHLFKEVSGKTYTEFVTFARIERAKEMLTLTDMPIRDVGASLGFEDHNYFSRCFKRCVGCSPSEYRSGKK